MGEEGSEVALRGKGQLEPRPPTPAERRVLIVVVRQERCLLIAADDVEAQQLPVIVSRLVVAEGLGEFLVAVEGDVVVLVVLPLDQEGVGRREAEELGQTLREALPRGLGQGQAPDLLVVEGLHVDRRGGVALLLLLTTLVVGLSRRLALAGVVVRARPVH